MYKGPMDEAKEGSIEGGRWGWVGRGKVAVVKWRQLYLNNKKERKRRMNVNEMKRKIITQTSLPTYWE